jgi:hypothetical protein
MQQLRQHMHVDEVSAIRKELCNKVNKERGQGFNAVGVADDKLHCFRDLSK